MFLAFKLAGFGLGLGLATLDNKALARCCISLCVLLKLRFRFAMLTVGRRSSWEHDEKILQLYEEMEKHIDNEKHRIEQEVSLMRSSCPVRRDGLNG